MADDARATAFVVQNYEVAEARAAAVAEARARAIGEAGGAAPAADAAAEAEEGSRQAVTEILAELRGDRAPEPPPEDETTTPSQPPELPQDSRERLDRAEQDEAATTVAGPPAGDFAVPHYKRSDTSAPLRSAALQGQRQAAFVVPHYKTAGPRPVPQASTPRTLILLHALLLAVFGIGTWLTYHHVATTLNDVTREIHARPVAAPPAPASPAAPVAAPAPAPQGAEPILRLDEGLLYAQEVEKADLLFEKEQLDAAAAAYAHALAVMPPSWNDGAAAFRLAECHFRLKDYPRAIAAYERVASAYRGTYQPRALFQLGEAHFHLKAYRQAREAYYTLLLSRARYGAEAAPLLVDARYRIADTYWLEADSLASAAKGAE